MEEITGSTQYRVVDKFRYIQTLEHPQAYESEFFEVPKPFSGSKSENVQWILKIAPNFKTVNTYYKYKYTGGTIQQFRIDVTARRPSSGIDSKYFAHVFSDIRAPDGQSLVIPGAPARTLLSDSEYRRRDEFEYAPFRYIPRDINLAESSECTLVHELPIVLPASLHRVQVVLTIEIFELGFLPSPSNHQISSESLLQSGHEKSLKRLLDSGDLADITIVVTQGERIPAHKVLLAANSPVFQAMFSTNMMEASDNWVDIDDFDKPTVLGMLQYMYTGKCDQLIKHPQEMLQIADKYQVEGLRKACASRLVSGDLKVENAIYNLLLADRYNLQEFKNVMMQFFRKNHLEIAKSDDFKEFVKTNSDLYVEAMKG